MKTKYREEEINRLADKITWGCVIFFYALIAACVTYMALGCHSHFHLHLKDVHYEEGQQNVSDGNTQIENLLDGNWRSDSSDRLGGIR